MRSYPWCNLCFTCVTYKQHFRCFHVVLAHVARSSGIHNISLFFLFLMTLVTVFQTGLYSVAPARILQAAGKVGMHIFLD
jgi:hypothetical protein